MTEKTVEPTARIEKKLPVVRVTFVKTNSNSNEIQEFIKFWYNKADVVAVQNFRVPSYKSKDYEFLKIKSKISFKINVH